MDEVSDAIRTGREALALERLVLAIHDPSFPSEREEDIGIGSSYGRGGRALIDFVSRLGFDGIQLGPQGDTSLHNPSPYDGAIFTKSPSLLALGTLVEDGAWAPLVEGLLAPAVGEGPAGDAIRVRYRYAWRTTRRLLAAVHGRFAAAPSRYPVIARRFEEWRRVQSGPLRTDGDFEALAAEHGTDDWRRWPDERAAARDGLRARHHVAIDRHLFGQFMLAEQHRSLRAHAARAPSGPVALYGDLQIGYSHRDLWSLRPLFRADYRMGAPPSRTNPEGQAWGYPVLDPDLYERDGGPGPVVELLLSRVDRMLGELDGLRIDHPHGLVCPWVYRADHPQPAVAVGRGARLFCSPNLPDYPDLAAFAIPTPDQLAGDPGIPRYADDWVVALRDDQVARYGRLFDAIVARVAAAGRQPSDVVCEVLSTWPYPLRRVMARHGLGRFCVTQKADLTRPDDVYRSENATERDWIMVGNHDTPPIWALADAWQGTAVAAERAAYLARRLFPPGVHRTAVGHWLAADRRHLCQGMFAELFASRARRVSVFFADLFGLTAIYNRPGVVSEENWTLRLPGNFEALYRERLGEGAAFNVPLAMALACGARRGDPAWSGSAGRLSQAGRRLLRAARLLTPSLDERVVQAAEEALGGVARS